MCTHVGTSWLIFMQRLTALWYTEAAGSTIFVCALLALVAALPPPSVVSLSSCWKDWRVAPWGLPLYLV